MKTTLLSLIRRATALVLGLALILLGAFLVLAVVGWVNVSMIGLDWMQFGIDPDSLSQDMRIAWTTWSVVTTLAGAGLLWVSASGASRPERLLLSARRFEHGYGDVVVTVSQRTVNALVTHVVEPISHVRSCESQVDSAKSGWRVRCDVYVDESSSLPKVSASARSQIRQHLREFTGIPVADLQLDIDTFPRRNRDRLQ